VSLEAEIAVLFTCTAASLTLQLPTSAPLPSALADEKSCVFRLAEPAGSSAAYPGAVAVLAAVSGKRVRLCAAAAKKANVRFDAMMHSESLDVVAVPVRRAGRLVAVLQVVNKQGPELRFSDADLEAIETFGGLLSASDQSKNTEARATEATQRCQRLHNAIRSLRRNAATIRSDGASGDAFGGESRASIVSAVAAGARALLPSASCATVYLVVPSATANEVATELDRWELSGRFTRLPLSNGVASRCVRTGATQCCEVRSLADGDLSRSTDVPLGVVNVVSVLSVPLRAVDNGPVVAVLQLMTTDTGLSPEDPRPVFTAADAAALETYAEAAALFLAPHVSAEAGRLSADAFSAAVQRLQLVPTTHALLSSLTSTAFDITRIMEMPEQSVALDLAAKAAVNVIMATGLPHRYGCDEATLARYVLACRAHYDDTPYHNFFHVVDVCQTTYTYLYHAGAAQLLKPHECYALLVSTLAHDLGHTGTNNSFHTKTDTPLGILSKCLGGTSVLEVHHASTAIQILGTSGFDVFAGMEAAEKRGALALLVDSILGTDAARHNEGLAKLKRLAQHFDANDEVCRCELAVLLLHAADVSNPAKPFPICKNWAERVVEEFSRQGDTEREHGLDVSPLFNRDLNRDIPRGQVGFISFMVEPLFVELCHLLPAMGTVRDLVKRNKATWQSMIRQ
jgi:cAMP-specific phosphodiesterase